MGKWDISPSYLFTTRVALNESFDEEAFCLGIRYEWLLLVSLIIMVVIVSLGVAGNVLVFVSMYTCRSLRTANNALLLNLAAADLLACFFFTPMLFAVVTQSLVSTAVMPRFLCTIQAWLRFVCCSVQQITLSAISVQRYAAIVHPLKRTGTRERVIAMLIVSWTTSGCLSIAAIYIGSSPIYGLCPCQHGNETPTNLVDMYLLVPLGITCLLVVVFFYAMIFRTVRKHVKEKDGSQYNSNASGDKRKSVLTSCCCRMCGFNKANVVAPVSSISGDLVLPKQGNTSIVTPTLAIVKPDSTGMTTERTDNENIPDQSRLDTDNYSAAQVDPNPPKKGRDLVDATQTQQPDATNFVEILNFAKPDSNTSNTEQKGDDMDPYRNGNCDQGVEFCYYRRYHSLPDILAGKDQNNSQHMTQREVLKHAENMSESERDVRDLFSPKNAKFRRKRLGQTETSNLVSWSTTSGRDRLPVNGNVESSRVTFGEAECVANDGRPPSERQDPPGLSRDEGYALKGSDVANDETLSNQNVSAVVPAESNAKIYGEVCVMNPKSRERGRRKIEAKTAKRALFIIAAFVLCWFPITVITYLENVVDPVVEVKIFCLTFSILSAVINPVIYTFINTAYRNEFKRLLKKFCSR